MPRLTATYGAKVFGMFCFSSYDIHRRNSRAADTSYEQGVSNTRKPNSMFACVHASNMRSVLLGMSWIMRLLHVYRICRYRSCRVRIWIVLWLRHIPIPKARPYASGVDHRRFQRKFAYFWCEGGPASKIRHHPPNMATGTRLHIHAQVKYLYHWFKFIQVWDSKEVVVLAFLCTLGGWGIPSIAVHSSGVDHRRFRSDLSHVH